MSRAISRESFDELKNYLGVYLQQGRPILDADWNENQDIAVAALRGVNRETLGDGGSDTGFAIRRVIPPGDVDELDAFTFGNILEVFFGSMRFFLTFPGQLLDDFETPGFELSSPQGTLRIADNRPYQGQGFLRLSGHAGTVRLRRRLANPVDLSGSDLATFRYRRNRRNAPPFRFFVEDDAGKRTFWPVPDNPQLPADTWLPGLVVPLDVRFRILTETLAPALVGFVYSESLYVYGGTAPYTWTVTSGALPAGFELSTTTTDHRADIEGTSFQSGTFACTVRVADSGGRSATKDLVLRVQAAGPPRGNNTPGRHEQQLVSTAPFEAPDGTPADLTRIRAYGFEVPQDAGAPLVWDFDDLRLGSRAGQRALAGNNFVINGSQLASLPVDAALFGIFVKNGFGPGDPNSVPVVRDLVALLAATPDASEPSARTSSRLYVDGLTCLRFADTLYSEQADPNDPPLTAPTGQVRRDTVYVDVWTEAATYVDDPEIREVALGGPDTATRSRVRHRVRVAQGGGLPTGDGRGLGTLATGGSYTAQANRLYLVEVDTPGDIGTATVRWSDDNGSTIQRVIEAVPPGATRVAVEDASAFQPGDHILLRKEFGVEEHQVASVVGNVIGLARPTGDQLAALPAAGRVAGFTTFALADRPMVQRWNAFRVPIVAGQNEPTTSAAVPLNDGVAVRFGGHGMRAGDFWTFTTRFLPGDGAAGVDPVTRIERLDFQAPRGVIHHYARLGTLVRDPADREPDLIPTVVDQRRRAGHTATTTLQPRSATVTGSVDVLLAGVPLPTTAPGSNVLVFLSASISTETKVTGRLAIDVSFYNDEMTDPVKDPDPGRLFSKERLIELGRLPVGVDVPHQILFAGSRTSNIALGGGFVPTSVQIVATLDADTGSVELRDIQVVVLELKKSMELLDDPDS